MARIYRITVRQLVPTDELTKSDDRLHNPAGTYTFHDCVDEEDALDQFHSGVPIACLDDFEITAKEV